MPIRNMHAPFPAPAARATILCSSSSATAYFDEERITVENHALGGTSSRTFYNQLWPDVLKGVQAGDYVLIELGHNDNGPLDTWTARNSIPGIDPDTCVTVTLHDCRSKDWNGRVETVYSYGQYMRMFINDVRAKGAYPLIASLTPRNSWDNETTITRKWNTFTPLLGQRDHHYTQVEHLHPLGQGGGRRDERAVD